MPRSPTSSSPSSVPSHSGSHSLLEAVRWVQCDDCDAWRLVAPHVPDSELPEKWRCSQKHWDPKNAHCQAPQEADPNDADEKSSASTPEKPQTKRQKQQQQLHQTSTSSATAAKSDSPSRNFGLPVSASPPWPGMPLHFYAQEEQQRFYTVLVYCRTQGKAPLNEPFPQFEKLNKFIDLYALFNCITDSFRSLDSVPKDLTDPHGWLAIAQNQQLPCDSASLDYLQQVALVYLRPIELWHRQKQHQHQQERQLQQQQLQQLAALSPDRDPLSSSSQPLSAQQVFKSNKRQYNKRVAQPYNNAQPRRKVPWTPEEDAALQQALDVYGVGHWTAIIESAKFGPHLASHTAPELRNRWRAVQKDTQKKTMNGLVSGQQQLFVPQGGGSSKPIQNQSSQHRAVSNHLVERDYPSSALSMNTHFANFDKVAFDEEYRNSSSSESDSAEYSSSSDSDAASRRRSKRVKASKPVKQAKVKREPRIKPEWYDSDDEGFGQLALHNPQAHKFYQKDKMTDLWLTPELAIPVRHLKSYFHRNLQEDAKKIIPLLHQMTQEQCLNDRRAMLSRTIYQWLIDSPEQRQKLLVEMNEFSTQTQRLERRQRREKEIAQQQAEHARWLAQQNEQAKQFQLQQLRQQQQQHQMSYQQPLFMNQSNVGAMHSLQGQSGMMGLQSGSMPPATLAHPFSGAPMPPIGMPIPMSLPRVHHQSALPPASSIPLVPSTLMSNPLVKSEAAAAFQSQTKIPLVKMAKGSPGVTAIKMESSSPAPLGFKSEPGQHAPDSSAASASSKSKASRKHIDVIGIRLRRLPVTSVVASTQPLVKQYTVVRLIEAPKKASVSKGKVLPVKGEKGVKEEILPIKVEAKSATSQQSVAVSAVPSATAVAAPSHSLIRPVIRLARRSDNRAAYDLIESRVDTLTKPKSAVKSAAKGSKAVKPSASATKIKINKSALQHSSIVEPSGQPLQSAPESDFDSASVSGSCASRPTSHGASPQQQSIDTTRSQETSNRKRRRSNSDNQSSDTQI